MPDEDKVMHKKWRGFKYIKSSSTSPCSVLLAFTFSLFFLSSPSCPSSMLSFIFTYHTYAIDSAPFKPSIFNNRVSPRLKCGILFIHYTIDLLASSISCLWVHLFTDLFFYVHCFVSFYCDPPSFWLLSLGCLWPHFSENFVFLLLFSVLIFLLLFSNKVVNAPSKMPFVCGGLNG